MKLENSLFIFQQMILRVQVINLILLMVGPCPKNWSFKMTARSNQRPTLDLQRADAAHHIHPFTNMAELNMNGTRVISRAKGIHVYDSEGKEYLDAMAGLWCVNIGYGRPELGQVAKDQMDQL